jgi:TolB-like protein/Tfp pilus assembly protein PilF
LSVERSTLSVGSSAAGGPAVFLSYASQDKEVAQRICEGLRAAGVEVWFDQSELRGGDAWDALIRKRIKECALFIPLITANTNARAEGYFRLEWKLAVDRSHLMADDAPFLFPVVIGDVTDATARVPDKFRDVQWTRLPVRQAQGPEPVAGRLDETPAELGTRVARLLAGNVGASSRDGGNARGRRQAAPRQRGTQPTWLRYGWTAVGISFALIFAIRPLFQAARRPAPKPAAVAPIVPAAPAPASEARKLAEKARAIFDKIDSNADDYAVAESLLKRALELDATDGVIWAYSARLNAAYLTRSFERGTDRAETARNHAERAVKLAPESAEAWHALGRAIWRSDPARAEEALRHALQLAPNDGHILISLGSIYRNQGRDDDALAFYVRAAAQPEVKSLALYDQFLIHLYLRRFAEAERCGREAGAILPTTNNVTGIALLEIVWQGRVDSAQRTLDAAPAAMRSEPRMVFAAALTALMAKQPDEALRALDRLPGDFISDAWYSGPKALFVGLAHTQAGRPEGAHAAWEAGLAVVRRRLQDAPNDAELHLRLGEMLAWTGQAEPALHEARVFEELARIRTDWTFSSARIYAALGRADAAVPILEKFLTATATGRWPLTPALLRLDPIWDKLRGDPRFQKLCGEPAAAPPSLSLSPSTPSVADSKSVAVLAFENLSDDKANEYFSEGISEELLNVLTKVPGLKVSARTSAFSFKGRDVPVPEIARQLGVAYVVEGSVRKQGDKVRIAAQLVKAADGFQMWSDTFTRDLKDIFGLQDEIAGIIARNLSVTLAGAGQMAREIDPEAHRLVLEGRHFWNLRTNDGFDRAEAAFRRAMAIDPGYASAHAGLANVLVTRLAYRAYEGATDGAYEEARAEARRAIELDPADAQVYMALGLILTMDGHLAESGETYRKAMGLNPNYALAHHWLSLVLETEGLIDEALLEIGRAVELDPLSGIAVGTQARMLQEAGRYPEAFATFERAAAILPDRPTLSASRAMCLLRLGRRDEAVEWARKAAASASRELRLVADADAILVLRQTGHEAEAAAHAERLQSFLAPQSYQRGAVLAAMGRFDEALPYLERTPRNMTYTFYWNAVWDAWREDPRFMQLLQKLGRASDYRLARETVARLNTTSKDGK